MDRVQPFLEGERYHVFNRGVEKRVIFNDQKDYERFLMLLFVCNGEKSVVFRKIQNTDFEDIDMGLPLVSIEAYCLMPNHFHLLLSPLQEGGVSTFMEKVQTAYSMYFNKKNERKGRLMESSFHDRHVDSDEYYRYLFSYIHLNPLSLHQPDWEEVGIYDFDAARQYLETYTHSSFWDYRYGLEKRRIIDKASENLSEVVVSIDNLYKDLLNYT